MSRDKCFPIKALGLFVFLTIARIAFAQLDENCTATLLNRSVPLRPDGGFFIPNVPVEPGLFRVRVFCTENGVTRYAHSAYVFLTPNGITSIGPIAFGDLEPMPVLISISASKTDLFSEGETSQLTATALFADGNTTQVNTEQQGTFWSSSNPNIASVNQSGLVTAHRRGDA